MLLGAGRGVQTQWAWEGEAAGARQVVKQIRRGEQEKNKEERERKMGPQRRKSSTKRYR